MKNHRTLLLTLAFMLLTPLSLGAQEDPVSGVEETTVSVALQMLGRSFFEWRRVQQPAQGDDIPRVERPDGWVPDFSPEALETYREQYTSPSGIAGRDRYRQSLLS